MNYEKAVNNIREALKTYIKENRIQSLVIGVSGGIDSALCAALAKPVCDELKIPLIGRSIPIRTNTSDERDRAIMVGQTFCTNFDEIYNIVDVYGYMWSVLKVEGWEVEEPNEKIRMGNVKARLRMIALYDLAQLFKGMVLSTDNWTEYLLGFWTLHGDVGDYGMIQELWKTEVYEMSEWLVENEFGGVSEALQSCIDCQATDGLGISKTDLEQILPTWEGSSKDGYKLVDLRLQTYLTSGIGDLDDPVIHRYHATHFKRNNPFNIKKSDINGI